MSSEDDRDVTTAVEDPPETRVADMWVAGSEESDWMLRSTDEGSQEMEQVESGARLAEQLGTVVGDDYIIESDSPDDERMIVNMGPQHPSTHGVLRLQVELEGEIIRRTKPIIGYLHTGMEKTGETLTYLQGPTNVTRMDYLAPLHNELVFSMAVERLLEIEVPPRAQAIRILMTELNRVSSHLVALATNGMDIGAISMMLYGFRERETVLAFFEKVTGLRMNHNYIRPGGVGCGPATRAGKTTSRTSSRSSPPSWASTTTCSSTIRSGWSEPDTSGSITPEECLGYGITGPTLRSAGVDWDLRKTQPYSGIEQYDFDVITGENGDVYDRYLIRVEEILQSLRIARSGGGADAPRRLAYRGSQGDATTAGPDRRVDGGADPPLQDLHRGFQGSRGRGLRGGRVSSW